MTSGLVERGSSSAMPAAGCRAHQLQLLVVDRTRLVEHVGGHRHVADVVHERPHAQQREALLDAVVTAAAAVVEPAVAPQRGAGEHQPKRGDVDRMAVGVLVGGSEVLEGEHRVGCRASSPPGDRRSTTAPGWVSAGSGCEAAANIRADSSNAPGTHSATDEQPRHRGEHDQAHDALLGLHDAGQPCVADPRPPQRAEDEHSLAPPVKDGSAAISAVHCVMASTNTRSKNSSSGVTRSSSRSTALTRWVEAGATEATS
jgi:hypothetical protein